MTKIQFLLTLNNKLSDLPKADIEERLTFYSEMIEDRMEEGLTEEEAVEAVGDVDRIAAQIREEIPVRSRMVEPVPSKHRFSFWEILLLVLGSPVWFSLLIAAAAVVFSLFISVWAVIISLWSVFASLAACSIGILAAAILFFCTEKALAAVAMIGLALICAGLAIFAFYGCRAATAGTCRLTIILARWVKNRFIRKGVRNG